MKARNRTTALRRWGNVGWLAALALGAAAIQSMDAVHAAPSGGASLIAQAGQGSGGQGADGGAGSTGGGQWKHPESGATSPSGSSAVGPGDSQGQARDASPGQGGGSGKHSGNDTKRGSSKGASGMSGSSKGSAANSDKGPGHRGMESKPGH